VNRNVLLEEEKFDDFKEGIYYPFNIGDVFAYGYQVVGSSDMALSSTVLLERDLL
jgi:serine/threonine-protein kinase SRPK3